MFKRLEMFERKQNKDFRDKMTESIEKCFSVPQFLGLI